MPRRSTAQLGTDPEQVRAALVQAAIECFERYSMAKTTMDDIATAANVSRPTVYRYFDDRDSLILAVIVSRSQDLLDRARHKFAGYDTFEERLIEGLLWLVDMGRRDPYVRMLVSEEHMDLANRILGTGSAAAQATAQLWTPFLEGAIESGELDPDLDLANACQWLTYVQLILVGRMDLDAEPDEMRAMLRDFVLPGFKPPT